MQMWQLSGIATGTLLIIQYPEIYHVDKNEHIYQYISKFSHNRPNYLLWIE